MKEITYFDKYTIKHENNYIMWQLLNKTRGQLHTVPIIKLNNAQLHTVRKITNIFQNKMQERVINSLV